MIRQQQPMHQHHLSYENQNQVFNHQMSNLNKPPDVKSLEAASKNASANQSKRRNRIKFEKIQVIICQLLIKQVKAFIHLFLLTN